MLRKIWSHVKKQTVVGWTAGWVGGVLMNGLLRENWDWKFWAALNAVLLLRISIDLLYAWHDTK